MTRTVTIAGTSFAITTETVRAIVAAAQRGAAPAMLLACERCSTVCTGGYTDAAVNAPCACCTAYAEMHRLKPPGRGRPRAADIGQHVRAPLGATMRTLTKLAA